MRHSRSTQTMTIINNGVIMLGVHDEGQLNVGSAGSVVDGLIASASVGLKYFRDGSWFDSTSYGCECEGFGVSARVMSSGIPFWAGANQSSGGISNLTPDPIISDGISASTFATVTTGPLSVKHEFAPSIDTPNLYEVKVTLHNTSPTESLQEIRYRRTMDWDIPPTPFSECVSIFYGGGTKPRDLEYVTDDGFEGPNPLDDTSTGGINFSCPTGGAPCPVYDNGPSDHGANFQFLFLNDDLTFVTLAPGEELKFVIYYGAAANKVEADAALAASGAELASYGYPPTITAVTSTCSDVVDGSPGVYIFGFGGVGSPAIFPQPSVSPSSVPSTRK